MKEKIVLAILIIVLSSCDDFEFRGYFTSYENANERFEQSIEWNTMNDFIEINVPQSTYTIHAMSDSHVGGTVNLDTFFKDASDENVTAAVMLGDLTTGHKEDFDVFSEHLPSKDSLTYFAVAGNHDLFFDGWKQFYSIFGSSSYFFVVNTSNAKDLFICLDTAGGTLGNKQLNWFKTLLEANRNNYRYCFVLTHNHLFDKKPSVSLTPQVEEIHVLLDLFVRHDVNMVVAGHDHNRNTTILGNTTYIIMDALQDVNDDASYLKLTINEESIDYSFVELSFD